MPQILFVLLFLFAVLAFAWFYLQRAKARPTTMVETHETDAPVAAPADRPE